MNASRKIQLSQANSCGKSATKNTMNRIPKPERKSQALEALTVTRQGGFGMGLMIVMNALINNNNYEKKGPDYPGKSDLAKGTNYRWAGVSKCSRPNPNASRDGSAAKTDHRKTDHRKSEHRVSLSDHHGVHSKDASRLVID